MQKTKLKKHDSIRIIAGKHKGKEGMIESINTKTMRVVVKADKVVNLVHQKPTQENAEGGIVEKSASVHISNVALINPKNKKEITKVGYKLNSKGKKVRFAKSTDTEIGK